MPLPSCKSAATELSLTTSAVRSALAYYGMYSAEIDAEIDANERAAESAHQAWQAQQRLLA